MKAPCLCPDTVADDDALAMAINDLLLNSKVVRKLGRKVRHAQERLRRRVGDRGWAAYLRLEQIMNQRAADEAFILVRWAYEAGRHARR